MSPREPAVVVRTYGFNIPCRRFLITAHITRDRRLPIVDEFVLRLLRTAGSLPLKALGAYFGFSARETEIVVSELAARSLIEVRSDSLSLHPSGAKLFRGDPGSAPVIMDTETWVERLWFDLVNGSGNMLPTQRLRPAPYLLDLDVASIVRDLPTAFARRAFEENFADYLRFVRKVSEPEKFALYAISAIAPETFATAMLSWRDELVFGSVPTLRSHCTEIADEGRGELRALWIAMGNVHRRLSSPVPSKAAFDDFARLTGTRALHAQATSVMQFELARWMSEGGEEAGSRRRTIGAPYVPANVDEFVKIIEGTSFHSDAGKHKQTVELFWFRPSGSRWGVSSDLADAVSKIRQSVRARPGAEVSFKAILVTMPATQKERPHRFKRLFDSCYEAPSGHLSPAIEVVLVRGVAAIVLVEAPLSPSASVPVGTFILDTAGLKRLETTLQVAEMLERTPLWAGSVPSDAAPD